MSKQLTLATEADGGFQTHRKPTRSEVFLAEMDKVVPWSELCAVIEPFYPKARGKGERRPVGLERIQKENGTEVVKSAAGSLPLSKSAVV